MKNMRLGMKIALGFGVLIVIAGILGAVGIWNMGKVEKSSGILSAEYVPQVAMAMNLSNAASRLMYEMRGYGFSEEKSFWDAALKEAEALDSALKDGEELEAKAKNLTDLKEQLGKATAAVAQYKQLMTKTNELITAMDKNRDQLDEAAGLFMKSGHDFLEDQIETFNSEMAAKQFPKLSERQRKINMVNTIVDLGNNTRIAAFKSMAMRNPDFIQDAQKNFDAMETILQDIRKITRKEANLAQIEGIRDAAGKYKAAMNGFSANWTALQNVASERTLAGNIVLETCAATASAGMKSTNSTSADAVSSLSSSKMVMIIGLFIAVIVGCGVAYIITTSITVPINRVINGLSEASDQVASASGQVSMAS